MTGTNDIATCAWTRLSALGRFVNLTVHRGDASAGRPWHVVLTRGDETAEGRADCLPVALTRALELAERRGWKE